MSDHLDDKQLNAYIHQTLTDDQREVMNRHLADCQVCRSQLADSTALQQRIRQTLLADLRNVHPSAAMTFSAIAPQLQQRRSPMFRRFAFRTATAVMAAALVIVLVILAGNSQPATVSTSSAVATNQITNFTYPPLPDQSVRPTPAPTRPALSSPGPAPAWALYTKSFQGATSMAFDHEGYLWLGWQSGSKGTVRFVRLNPKDGSYTQDLVQDDLNGNLITSISVAPDGAVWFSTYDGISRFDGKHWKTYTTADGLPSGSYWRTAVAPNGDLWVGTIGPKESGAGAFRFNGKTWTIYTTQDGLAGNDIQSMAVSPDGVVWFGTNHGLSRFDGKNWHTYTEADSPGDVFVEDMTLAPDGTIWLITSNAVFRFDGKTWTTYFHSEVADSGNRSIATAPNGTAWLRKISELVLFDSETWTAYDAPANVLTGSNDDISSFAVAPDGAVWLSTGNGVFRFDTLGSTSKPGIATATDSAVKSIPTLYPSVYSTTSSLTLAPLSFPLSSTVWTLPSRLASLVSSIAIGPNNVLWFGIEYNADDNDNGVFRFDNGTWTHFTITTKWPGIESINVEPTGIVWAKTGNDVFRFDGETWQRQWESGERSIGCSFNCPHSFAFEPGGEWTIGDHNISSFDGVTWQHYQEPFGGFPPPGMDYSVSAVARGPDGTMWFSAYAYTNTTPGITGTLLNYAGRDWIAHALPDMPGVVSTIAFAHNGSIWLSAAGTEPRQGSLTHFDGTSWKVYTSANGLEIDYITDMAVAPDDSVWFTTLKGVYRFDGKTFETVVGNEDFYSLAISSTGEVWLGGAGKVVRLSTAH